MAVKKPTARKIKKSAMEMKTMKTRLLPLTLAKAPLWNAWSYVCQMMIKSATELSLLIFKSVIIFLVALGKKF